MKKFFIFFPFAFALIFIYLFKGQQAGINVLIFNLILLGAIYWAGRLNINNRIQLLLVSGSVISAFMVLIHGSSMAMAADIFSLILLLGFIAAGDIGLLLNGFPAALFATASGPYYYIAETARLTNQKSNGRKVLRFLLVVLAPIVFLMIFTTIYATASPYFNKLTGGLLERLEKFMEALLLYISPIDFWLFVAGFLIFIAFLSGKSHTLLVFLNEKGGMQLFRKRTRYSGRMTNLKTEYRSGVVMLVLLNIVIATMNVLDIYNVWFNFEWNGDYLKQFVHEGTWLLIFSIIISIFIVLYYFRANLNFYPKRKLLLNLALLWLAQNALLAISVGIRNMWYIHHFNLAYKRIGVYAFLLLTLFGIATVIIKIRQRKTHRYLFHYNSLAAYTILICLSFFNWDKIIASFNADRSEKGFFHPEFMVTLNSSALPELMVTTRKIERIEAAQTHKFDYYHEYMSLYYYKERIEQRQRDFINGYSRISWLGWNYADYQAYHQLTDK
ncbi:MAG: DUF4173 domain-containing protein [Bacteroidales bacterium]|nr:DUF4173 domain-containing protein [Bacteroidales bacterium]